MMKNNKKGKIFGNLGKLLIIMVIGLGAGIAFAFLFHMDDNFILAGLENFEIFFIKYSVHIFFILEAILILIFSWLYIKGKKELFESLPGLEDGEDLNDKKLSLSIGISSIAMIIQIFMMGPISQGISNGYVDLKSSIAAIVVALLSIAGTAIFQRHVIELIKKVFPEKKGEVYNLNFQKEWVDSCDEHEKIQIYYSGYKAYTVIKYILLAGLVLFQFLGDFFKIGIYPCLFLAIVYIVGEIVYLTESNKKSINVTN